MVCGRAAERISDLEGAGEIIAILSVGIGLGLLSTGLFAWLRTDMVKVEERLRADIKQLADRVGRLEYGQAKLEGLLEGLREAITGRAAS